MADTSSSAGSGPGKYTFSRKYRPRSDWGTPRMNVLHCFSLSRCPINEPTRRFKNRSLTGECGPTLYLSEDTAPVPRDIMWSIRAWSGSSIWHRSGHRNAHSQVATKAGLLCCSPPSWKVSKLSTSLGLKKNGAADVHTALKHSSVDYKHLQ